jgi:hypothetical protein
MLDKEKEASRLLRNLITIIIIIVKTRAINITTLLYTLRSFSNNNLVTIR